MENAQRFAEEGATHCGRGLIGLLQVIGCVAPGLWAQSSSDLPLTETDGEDFSFTEFLHFVQGARQRPLQNATFTTHANFCRARKLSSNCRKGAEQQNHSRSPGKGAAGCRIREDRARENVTPQRQIARIHSKQIQIPIRRCIVDGYRGVHGYCPLKEGGRIAKGRAMPVRYFPIAIRG